MRGRLLVFTILTALALALIAANVVSSFIDSSWDLTVTTNSAGLVVLALGNALSELGRHCNGRISPVWMIVVIFASAAALVVAGIAVFNGYRDVARVVDSIVMAGVVITTSIYVIMGNRGGRLGMDRQPRRKR